MLSQVRKRRSEHFRVTLDCGSSRSASNFEPLNVAYSVRLIFAFFGHALLLLAVPTERSSK